MKKKINIQERIPMVLIGMLIAAILMVSSAFPASAVSRTYTTDADFNEGILVGLEHETVHDQLQLNKTSTAFPFIWVPNTGEGTISKVDTRTGNETGRYRVTPPGLPFNGSPSRTTVDLEGNVWVGNRRAGTVVKVGLYELGYEVNQCTDRNGNGSIDTSMDTDSDGNITGSELLPWGQDECVLYEVVLIPSSEGTYVPGTYPGPYDTDYWGVAPRGLAIDKNNNLWAGTWSTSKYYYINGTNGQIINTPLDVSPWDHHAYGAVMDSNSILWSAQLSSHVLRINTSNLSDIMKIPLSHTYGIGIDNLGHLFVGGGLNLSKINRNSGAFLWTKPANAVQGVTVTIADNNVWVAGSGLNKVTRYDNDGNLVAEISGFSYPTGVGVDAAGKVWATDLYSDNIYRIDPDTNTIELTKPLIGSGGHYTYSDVTGYVARTITTTIGTWTVTYDSGSNSTVWGRVTWNASIPAGASINVKIRTNNDSNDLPSSTYQSVSNSIDFPAVGRYIQIEVRLTASPAKESPILYDLLVESITTKIISGTKINDLNGNHVRDSDEPGMPGIGIQLFSVDPNGIESLERFTYTDINGNYSFMDIALGNYHVREDISGLAMSQSFPNDSKPIEIEYNALGQTFPGSDFGNSISVLGGEIRGTKFNDSDGNGTQDAEEQGIPNVTICLWPSSRCTTTDSSGNYIFSNIAPGTQTVYEHVPPGNASTTPSMVTVTVNSGETTIVNFGNRVIVPPPPDIAIPGAIPDVTDFYKVPAVLNIDPVVIQKNLSNIFESTGIDRTNVVAVNLTLKWSDGTTRKEVMTEIGTTSVWEITLNPPFPSGAAEMTIEVDIDVSPPGDIIERGDIIFLDPSGKILDACTGAPIEGATATLLVEFLPTTGNFIVSPTGLALPYQLPDINPLTTGADGRYSWMTVPGTFKVRAEKPGYITAESPPVSVPPPVFDLDIRLTPVEKVAIDIKPGTYPNSINLGSGGTVPVAILSTATFDATTIDPLTVTLASAPVKLKGKGTPMTSTQDVNGDGLTDLVVHVSTEALALSPADTEAVLEGKAYCGKLITGSDSVRIVPP